MDRVFHAKDESHIKLVIDKDTTALICVDGDLTIDVDANGHKLDIVYIVDTDDNITFKETVNINDSEVSILYFDISEADVSAECRLTLGKGASLSLIDKYLVSSKKNIDIACINEGSMSSVSIDNSAVILDDGYIDMRCAGKILKGAYGSKSHQKTRSLVYGSPKRVAIDPVLLIEESDVEASHALSNGTIDEDVLYYMNSRGIDKKAALHLLIESYLVADEVLLAPFSNKNIIKEHLDRRVERYVR